MRNGKYSLEEILMETPPGVCKSCGVRYYPLWTDSKFCILCRKKIRGRKEYKNKRRLD